jgi:hypothetical protein
MSQEDFNISDSVKDNKEIINKSKSLTLNILEKEKWRSLDFINYPYYQISTYGRIISLKLKRFLNGSIDSRGYIIICLTQNGISQQYQLHRLVALAFIPYPDPNCNSNDYTVDHIDRNKTNNFMYNLRWATSSEQNLNRNNNGKLARPIYQLCDKKNIIAKWNSASEIENSKVAGSAKVPDIRFVCNNPNIKLGGYFWRYADLDDLEGEIWKLIPYIEYGQIFASNMGRIKFSNGRITIGSQNNGYLYVSLKDWNKSTRKSCPVHRLIMAAFYGEQPNKQVNHKNGNGMDNYLNNLEYVTAKENSIHAVETGLRSSNHHTRPIILTDASGKETRFKSSAEASNVIKISKSHITSICNGSRSQTVKYRLRYADAVF